MTGRDRAVVPLPGPIAEDPTLVLAAEARGRYPSTTVNPAGELAREMLDTALDEIDLGAYDARIVEWLRGWDQPTVATVASLIRRAFLAGVAAGRTEKLNERPVVASLSETLAEATRALAKARAENDRQGRALDAVVAAAAVFEDQLGGLEPSGITGALLAAIETAIGGGQ